MNEERKEALIRKYTYAAKQAEAQGRGPGRGGPGTRGGRGRGGRPKDASKTVRRLLSYIEKDRLGLAVVFFCVILNTLSSLAGSYMLRPIINSLTSAEGSVQILPSTRWELRPSIFSPGS